MGVLGESLPAVLLEYHAPCTHSLSFCIRSVSEVNPTSKSGILMNLAWKSNSSRFEE
ncbi:hypothetical protein SLEP1_g39343 [Rubroshorea leprosula]|uniref:Uncharacterized protein n=1 Tax=Rubroshorea leprosula TaxID=152421 RepID=A0AAV5L0B3_9ROSI|nr:hypothetical protein SLEP1_g39343 [Rubroshorea leprosula]